MTKTYDFGNNTQLSPHFNVQEFKCKCGKEHEILIAEELIEKLEMRILPQTTTRRAIL